MQRIRCFGHGQMCLWWTYKAHFNFRANSLNSNTFCLYWSERHWHVVQSKSIGVHSIFWWEFSFQCRIGLPLYTKRPWSSNYESEITEKVHAINYAYEMPYKVPCANSCGSSKFISLCNKWIVILIMAWVLYTGVTNHHSEHFMT